jgi:2-keto-4-pentenoate hydratase
MAQTDIVRAGNLLAQAWRTNKQIALLPDGLRPATREQALAIQDLMIEYLGEEVGGWKIGATSDAVQRKQRLDGPIPGRIIAPWIFSNPANIPRERCPGASLECEIAFRLTKDLPWRKLRYTGEDLAPIVVLHFAVEVTGSRYAAVGNQGTADGTTLGTMTPYDLIADNGGGAAFVFGKEFPNWQRIPFGEMKIDLRIDGGAPADNFFGEYRRDPIDVLAITINHAMSRQSGLSRGQYVSTGSMIVPPTIRPGQMGIAKFADFDEIRVSID